ncbi:MAG TPA: hypothetical protein VGQ83_05155 [Polyangia bacterium]|jgi:hypothetical protein
MHSLPRGTIPQASRRRAARAIGVSGLVSSLLLAGLSCGGGSGSPTPSSTARTGQLVYRVMMPLPADFVAGLTDEHRAALQADGTTLQDAMLMFPDVPARGEWIELAGTRTMANETGVFQLDAAAPRAGTAQVFRQYRDTVPFASFDVGGLADVGQAPPVIPLEMEVAMPEGMDCDPAGAGAHGAHLPVPRPDPVPGCALRDITGCTTNASPCCLDYNGLGDGYPYARGGASAACFSNAVLNWTGSTCYNWSFGVGGGTDASCLNEGAYHPTDANAPNCWANHRGRNCQTLDLEALSVKAPGGTTVSVGEQLTIVISNNTPGNESVVKIISTGPKGEITGPGVNTDDSVDHWEPGGTGGFTHYVDRSITFTAPSDLQGKTSITNTLEVQSHGKTVSIDLTITKEKPLTGTFSIGWSTLGGSFDVEGTATLAVETSGADGIWYTMSGTAEMKTTVFNWGGQVCTLPDDGNRIKPILNQSNFVVYNDPPAVTWSFIEEWDYDCGGGNIVPVIVNFATKSGGMGCPAEVKVPVLDATKPEGTYTMDCMSPASSGTAQWSFTSQ